MTSSLANRLRPFAVNGDLVQLEPNNATSLDASGQVAHASQPCNQSIQLLLAVNMAASATTRDIPILVTSPAASSERRVNPSWTISQLKAKLEPITGIAPSLQTLTLRLPDHLDGTAISAKDEDRTEIGAWSFPAYAELHVGSSSFFDLFGYRYYYVGNILGHLACALLCVCGTY